MRKILTIMAAVLMALPLFATSSKSVWQAFQNPSDAYRPYVRWWWNGDRVDEAEIRRELNLLKEAGIAGVEINPISFPGRQEDAIGKKTLIWLSDEWIDMLGVAFDEAKKLGMTCDLIVGSGWPFGAENLPRDERASVILTLCDKASGGTLYEKSKFHVFKELDPGVSITNPRRTPELLKALLVPDPINDLGEAVDVTERFQDDVLKMKIPAGNWQVYYMVKYDSFASVINGAPGAAGSILDHMNAEAVRKYLDHMSDRIESRLGPLSQHLRAFFVDSMELEGTNWTGDFAEQFKARRGYDVMPWLPFTMFKVGRLGDVLDFNYGCKKGEKFQEQVNRVRFDFELTKAELLDERFFRVYEQWAREKGVKSRAQGYGRGFFIEETSMGLDIPEGESWTTNWLRHRIGEEMGDEDYRRGRAYTMIDKYVSSAAHLTGKRLVSCEEMTNTYKVFSTPLELLKVGSDMSCISGITHSVWHGFNYSPKEAPFPGWVQYGSYYNEKNTWWPYWKLLNDYRARLGALVRNADMYTDIAILPANYDMWTEMGVQTEPFPVKLNVPYTSLVWEAIHKNGGGADYVSERILKDATVDGGKLCYGPKKYSVLFLVSVKGTTLEAMQKIREFVLGGGRVFCIANAPSKSVGFSDFERRDAQIAEIVSELEASGNFTILPAAEGDHYLEWYTDVMQKYGLPVQSHLSENYSEIAWIRELCPKSKNYGDAYDQFGMFGGGYPCIMAHCVHSDEREQELIARNGVFVAHAPESNINLASGVAPVSRFLDNGLHVGLSTDVAGGSHESMLRAVMHAIQASKLRWRLYDQTVKPLSFERAFYLATMGGGAFFGQVGTFRPGYAFDAAVLDDSSLDHPQELSLRDRLERAVYLADDRNVTAKYVAGRRVL